MHYRISQWLCVPLTPGCWNAKSDSGVEGKRGKGEHERGKGHPRESSQSAIITSTVLSYTASLFYSRGFFSLLLSYFLPNHLYSQRIIYNPNLDRTEQLKEKLNLFKIRRSAGIILITSYYFISNLLIRWKFLFA